MESMVKENTQESNVPLAAVTAAVGAVILLIVLLCGLGQKKKNDFKKNNSAKENLHSKKQVESKKKRDQDKDGKDHKHDGVFSHPWLLVTLKGYLNSVLDLDFSSNGKFLGSCCEDSSVLIWNVKDFEGKDRRSLRASVKYDYGKQIKFSPDSKAFIVSTFNGNTIQVYKIFKKADGNSLTCQHFLDFPKKHTAEIINIGISSSGKFIMSCSNDTTIIIWDLKGQVLATIDTKQMNNYFSCLSPCGRFVASTGFTPDVKVWEVVFSKTGEFKEVVRAFELKGHSSGVYSVSFSNDSHRMASVSKDGTWKVWDTDINYSKGQEPYLLLTGQYNHSGRSLIAISPDAKTVALACHRTIHFFHSDNVREEMSITNVHSEPITALAFDSESSYLATSGDRQVRIFHNIVGLKVIIKELEEKLSKAPKQSVKERIEEQLDQHRSKLQKIIRSEV